MATIGFVMLPEPGHLNPSFKLAKGLRLRGHQICYFGPIGTDGYVDLQGFRFIAIPECFYPLASRLRLLERSCETAATASSKEYLTLDECGRPVLAGDQVKDEGEARAFVEIAVKTLAGKFTDSRVDMLIFDPTLPFISIVACLANIRTAFLSTSLLFPFTFEGVVDHPLTYPDLPALFLCPHEFAYPHAAPRERQCYYIESSVDMQRREGDLPGEITKDKPLIYCSLGSQNHRYPEAKQVFQAVIDAHRARPDWQLVLATGDRFGIQDFHDIPPNAILVKQAPQLKILRQASVMITHGGLGTVKECILFGVPMIVFPFDVDQPLNASRVVSHGLGLSGNPRTVSADQVNTYIDRINNDLSLKARIETLSRRFQEIEYSGVGAQTIDQLLKHKVTKLDPGKDLSERISSLILKDLRQKRVG
jgi:UDP:flavonoid glycosyltransferase YjiC (YdhE family)